MQKIGRKEVGAQIRVVFSVIEALRHHFNFNCTFEVVSSVFTVNDKSSVKHEQARYHVESIKILMRK